MRPSFDEMRADANTVREHYRGYDRWLGQQPNDVMLSRREEAEVIFRRVGITFAVYGAKDEDGHGNERLIPFDLIPRVIPSHEWLEMQKGLAQRVTALNRFIHDVYHGQEIIKAGHVPAEQILTNAQFRPEMMGVDLPGGIYSHISGIDIIRAANADGSGSYYVLEDNLRVPSGVSYMLEDRKMMMRLFPELFSQHRVAPVAHYPDLLLETLRSVAPPSVNEPTVVVLTPGMHNSAYFEHAFLAQQMGIELVEGQDLFVKENFVYMRTTQGPKRVDVISVERAVVGVVVEVFPVEVAAAPGGTLHARRAGTVEGEFEGLEEGGFPRAVEADEEDDGPARGGREVEDVPAAVGAEVGEGEGFEEHRVGWTARFACGDLRYASVLAPWDAAQPPGSTSGAGGAPNGAAERAVHLEKGRLLHRVGPGRGRCGVFAFVDPHAGGRRPRQRGAGVGFVHVEVAAQGAVHVVLRAAALALVAVAQGDGEQVAAQLVGATVAGDLF